MKKRRWPTLKNSQTTEGLISSACTIAAKSFFRKQLLLMVASYNYGIGNVWEAMKKSGKTDPGFWDIKASLPAETQSYVMNFITLNVIFHNYEKFTDNTLLFTPTKVKTENAEGVMTEELNISAF